MNPSTIARTRYMNTASNPLMRLLLTLGVVANGCYAQSPPPDPVTQYVERPAAQDVTYWPVAMDATEGRVEVYQPQPEAMTGDKLTARATVSLTRPGSAAPVYGAAWFTAQVIIDRDTRMATLHDVKVSDVRLSDSTAAEQQDFSRVISSQLSATWVTFPLDQLTSSLDTARREQGQAARIDTTPPHILLSTTPTTLISVNGSPRLEPVEAHAGVSRVVNTPFILLLNDAERRYYLMAGPRWVSAPDLTGPWADAPTVPPAIAAAGTDLATPATQPSATTTASSPAAPSAAELSPAAADAKIVVATDPTELIVTDGNPQFTPVGGPAGGELLYASNTASDLFLDQSTHQYFVLLSGRWYSAPTFQGPWQYVASDHLSASFAQIPVDSPKADVLPFVAGTTEAHAAVLDAGVPQTASIRRDAGADLTVAYDGEPRFQDVPESPGVAYALNTPEDVLLVNGRYYCCHQAVWYESPGPTGPWTVCVSVPPSIYTLPPSCPAYHVTYVNVYDYTPDYVTCGYLPGYTGTYIYGPTIVYGTGYAYPGWYGTAYFPPPCTWGFSAYYDPFACAWGFDLGLYWGGWGWFCDPRHDRWWRDHPREHWGTHRWWGPGGFVHSHEIRGNLVGARSGSRFAATDRGVGPASRLPGAGRAGPGWNNLYSRGGNVARNVPADRIRSSTPARAVTGPRDNVFAGSDGRVYRQSNAGWEEHRGATGWSSIDRVPDARPTYRPPPPSAPINRGYDRPEAGLNQHSAARSFGGYRSSTINGFHGGGGGSFRGGGGGGGGHGGGGHR